MLLVEQSWKFFKNKITFFEYLDYKIVDINDFEDFRYLFA